MWFGSTTFVRNNIIWGNTVPEVSVRTGAALSVTYCDIRGGYTGTGNFEHDPGFVNAVCNLSDTSSCIDAGDPDPAQRDPQNPALAGAALWPSKGLVRNDVGAYGGPDRSSFPKSLPVTGIGKNHGETRPTLLSLRQNYPNPFNPTTRIEYQLSSPGEVRLLISDLLGRTIAELAHGHQAAGSYTRTWSAAGVSSGTYFYRLSLQTEDGEYFMQARRLVVVK